MRILVTDAAAKFTDLVGAAYVVPDRHASLLAPLAEATLAKANPLLASMDSVPKGTTVFVPEMAELQQAMGTVSAAKPLTDLLELQQTLLKDAFSQAPAESASAPAVETNAKAATIAKDDLRAGLPGGPQPAVPDEPPCGIEFLLGELARIKAQFQ